MTVLHLQQIAQLALEALLVATLLVTLFHLRFRFGLSPVFMAVGALQYLQVVLALSVYVEVYPGILVSPGSVVLFTANLFLVLLVYIREDAAETRKIVYGLLASNVGVVLLSTLFGRHLDSGLARNFLGLPRELFDVDLRMMLVGTGALVLDVVLVIVVYEAASRVLPRVVFLRALATLALVAAFDGAVFVTGAFLGRPEYGQILLSNVLGKVVAAAFYALLIAFYLRVFRPHEARTELAEAETRDIFDLLTYRQKYEAARERLVRDPLTGLFNRGFFDELVVLELGRSARSKRPVALLMIDIDRFKPINDQRGHPEGDRVLREVAAILDSEAREGDAACRYGGDEFVLIAPHAEGPAAGLMAERLRARIAREVRLDPPVDGSARVTVSIGGAVFPADATSAKGLVAKADRRLYRAKTGGRDRAVCGDRASGKAAGSPPTA